MSRILKVFVLTVVVAVTMVLGVGPAFAENQGDFPLETFVGCNPHLPPDQVGIGTGIITPGIVSPCVRRDVGPPDGDIIIE